MTRSNLRNLRYPILALALSGCVVYPQPGPGHVPAPQRERVIVGVIPGPQPEDPRLAQCRAANYRTQSEALQIYYRAQAAGNISSSEAQQFAAAEQRLRQHASMLARDGITVFDCEALGRDIGVERALIERMAASRPGYSAYRGDPALLQCRADAQRTHAETMHLYYRARASGAISPPEARQLAQAEQRLTRHAQVLARDGLTLRECESLQREIAAERRQVERMAASRPAPVSVPAGEPRLAECRANAQRAHAETMQQYRRARAAGAISPQEAQQLTQAEQRLTRHAQALGRDGLTLRECESLQREIAAERHQVERMAASRPAPAPARTPRKPDVAAQRPANALAQCSAANQKAHAETLKLYERARASGRITPQEAKAFAGTEQRLNEQSRVLARDGLTLQECEVLARSIGNERSLVERMAADH
jgi:hypothetical protein